MFDPPDRQSGQSLLMRAAADDGGRPDAAGRDEHRAARARRAANRPNPLLAALGAETRDEPPETEPEAPAAEPARLEATASVPPASQQPLSPSSSVRAGDGAPLIDLVALLQTVWRWRFFIAACTVAGAVIGVMVALSMPTRYTAYSQLLLDPRETQLVGSLEREFLANEAALAIVDSRLALAWSRPVLETVIERTNLDQDPEFNGSGSGSDFSDGIGLIRSLFSAETPVETGNRNTLQNLREAIEIDRTTRTFVVNIGVEASTPQKAALLANELTLAFVEAQSEISADKAGTATAALQERLGALRAQAEQAERRVEQFKTENNLVSAQGRILSDDDLAAANARLSEARAETARARARAEAASAITVDDAITGALPADLVSPTLSNLRAQLASLRQSAAQLQNQLGPRHPRLTSAEAAVDAARQDIATELRRIVGGAQAELQRAVQNEQELAAEAARARAVTSNSSDALVELRDLEGEAETARAVYNSALLRSRETGEIEELGTINATVLTEAEAPLSPSSTSRRVVAVAGTMLGFLFGVGCAVLAGLRHAVNFDFLKADRRRPDGTPFAGPGAPQPDPTAGLAPPSASQQASASSEHRNEPEDAMYPPYVPYPYGPYQPAAGQPATVQTVPVQPVMPQPVTAYAPHPYPPPQPGWPPAPPAPAMAPPQPWQPAAPAYGAPWPQPPAHPQGQFVPPVYAPQPAPAPMPAQWATPVLAPQAPVQAAPVQQAPAPAAPQPVHQAPADDMEMDELRQSLRDIRDVVDALADRRAGRFAAG